MIPQTQTLKNMVPAEWKAWKAEEDRSYDASTVFEYIDGAGEVYRSYNMKALFARRFGAEGQPALIVDLFDMGTSVDAFGVFTHDLEGRDAATGQGSTYKGGLLSFWKDRYFVSIYAEDETPEAVEAVRSIAREIAAAIPGMGRKPALLDILPPEGLDAGTVRFFHTHPILNYHFFVSDANILDLGPSTAAVLGDYPDGARLLAVEYPEIPRAAAALAGFRKACMPGAGDADAVMTGDGKWTAALAGGKIVVIAFRTATREAAEGLARRAAERIR